MLLSMHHLHKASFYQFLSVTQSFFYPSVFFSVFSFLQTKFQYSSFSIHQLHEASFIHCFCFHFFFQTKSRYSFLCITYIRLLFIHQLHKVFLSIAFVLSNKISKFIQRINGKYKHKHKYKH